MDRKMLAAVVLLVWSGMGWDRAQAKAADPLSCIVKDTDPAVTRRIGPDVVALTTDPARPASSMDDIQARLAPAGARCAARLGWNDAALKAAMDFALADLSVDPIKAVLARDGVDPALAMKVYYGLPQQTRGYFMFGDALDVPMKAFLAAAEAAKLRIATPAAMQHAGLLVWLIGMRDGARFEYMAAR